MDPIDPFEEADFAIKRLYDENEKLKASLAEKEGQLCRAREAFAAIRNKLKMGRCDHGAGLEAALSSPTPCPHEAELTRLREAVEKAACGPRIDPSKCSGCNGTGIGNCICGGKGTVEAERDGYKVAALERILRTQKASP